MEYKESEVTAFAEKWVCLSLAAINIIDSELVREVLKNDSNDNELIMEISRRYAKGVRPTWMEKKDQIEDNYIDGALADADLFNIFDKIIICCEENDWFGN